MPVEALHPLMTKSPKLSNNGIFQLQKMMIVTALNPNPINKKTIDQKMKTMKMGIWGRASPSLRQLMELHSMLIHSWSLICRALCSGLVRPWAILNQLPFSLYTISVDWP